MNSTITFPPPEPTLKLVRPTPERWAETLAEERRRLQEDHEALRAREQNLRDYEARFAEIYRRLAGRPSSARFVTALAVANGPEILFETETTIEGAVAGAPRGDHGFGYDPIFWYPPFARTTAELTEQEKAIVSHRARAFRDLRRFLVSHAR